MRDNYQRARDDWDARGIVWGVQAAADRIARLPEAEQAALDADFAALEQAIDRLRAIAREQGALDWHWAHVPDDLPAARRAALDVLDAHAARLNIEPGSFKDALSYRHGVASAKARVGT